MRRFILSATLLLPVCVHASTITYTETAIATGTFNSVSYTSALVTLTGTGDTSAVQGSGSLYSLVLPVTVTVAGIGTGTFTDSIKVVDNQSVSAAGFGDLSSNLAILFSIAGDFSSYNLRSSLAATPGSASFNPGATFGTTFGTFSISGASSATFQATGGAPIGGAPISVTPEPSSLALLGTGLLAITGLCGRRYRRA